MAHVEDQIRTAFIALVTGLPTTGDNVFASQEHPLTPDTMPGLCVYVSGDRTVGGTLEATSKEVEIAVDQYVEGAAFDGTMAEISKEVEEALYNSESNGRFFNGTVTNLVYGGHATKDLSNAAVRHGLRTSWWKCEYQTEDGDAETAT